MAEKHIVRYYSGRSKTILNMVHRRTEPENQYCVIPIVKKRQLDSQDLDAQCNIPKKKTITGDTKIDFINDLYSREYSLTSPFFDQICETQTTQNISHIYSLALEKLYSVNSKQNAASTKDVTSTQLDDSIATDLSCYECFVPSPQCEPNTKNIDSVILSQTPEVSYTKDDFDSDDSVLDKDYYPSFDSQHSSSSEEDINVPSTSRKTMKLLAKKRKLLQTPATDRESNPLVSNDTWTSKGKVPPNKRRITLDTLNSFQDKIEGPKVSHKRRNTWDGFLENINIVSNVTQCEEMLPERPQKRKKYSTSLAERKKEAMNNKRKEYQVKPGCNNCRKKCSTFFIETDREAVNSKFWKLTWTERRNFINNHVSVAVPKRKITTDPKRSARKTFTLQTKEGISVQVCKDFFLTTLGYKKSNDKVLYNSLCDESNIDKRGKHQKTAAIDRSLLTAHVESFHPTEPHYRREHAPLRKYLPSDVNITFMYNDFCEKHPDIKVSYELYRSHIKKMNISFTKLGHEECELCEAYVLHKKQTSHDILKGLGPDCNICDNWAKHHEKYTKARQLYDLHKSQKQSSSEIFYSSDLEKVIMLPRLDTFKAVIFCNRLTAYNQTFAPVGKITCEFKPLTVLWHDGIAGRKQEDIMSAFYYFLILNRDVQTMHIWLDNCSAQNKNWLLYSLIIHMVNSNLIATESIILYYFEPGHTFMSCDQVHHQVELAMKKKSKLYDFTDFEETVGTINNGRVNVKSMCPQNFLNLTNHVSERRVNNSNPRAYLKNMSQVCFQRGNYDLMYKNDFDSTYITLRFMNDKYLKNPSIMTITFRTKPKGVDQERKMGIVNKLSAIMPAHKMVFWRDLPIVTE